MNRERRKSAGRQARAARRDDSWECFRGIPSFQQNSLSLFVQAPPGEVAAALARRRRAETWERAISLGHPVVLDRRSYFVFRLKGHSWTQVLDGSADFLARN